MTDAVAKNYITRCVSCGGLIEVKNNISGKHTCPARHDAAQKASDTRAYTDVPTRRTPTFGTRLAAGFEMLQDDEIVTRRDGLWVF